MISGNRRMKTMKKKEEMQQCTSRGERERRNKITSLVKIGPPWSHFKASLMVLISGNDTLCRQTKKERMRAKKKVVLE